MSSLLRRAARKLKRLVVDPPPPSVRASIAAWYLQGVGLEIGALHNPLEVPPDATVRYVDRMPVSQLREQYLELADLTLVPVDIIDDGEVLSSVADDSQDFVITNHMIEHCRNPLATLKNLLRVLKPNGVLYLAVPDKRYTFDRDRPLTPLNHLLRDYEEGPDWYGVMHYQEWASLVDKVPEEKVPAAVQSLLERDYSIHFHVWDQITFLEMLIHCRKCLGFPFEIELGRKNDTEFITVLRKESARN